MIRQTNIFKETISRFKNAKRAKDLVCDIKDQIKMQRIDGMIVDPEKLRQKHQAIQKKYQRGSFLQKQQLWNEGERKLYLNFLLAYCYLHFKNINDILVGEWHRISQAFHSKNLLFLMYEGRNLQKSNDRVHWSPQQEFILQKCVKHEINGNWASISYQLFFQTEGEFFKTPKQCREHWFNHLNKKIKKGQWNIDEDIKILNFVMQNGRQWSRLGRLLQGSRTEHMIKNRFSTLVNMAKKYCNVRQTNNNTQPNIIKILLQYLDKNRSTIYELSIDNTPQISSVASRPIDSPQQFEVDKGLMKDQKAEDDFLQEERAECKQKNEGNEEQEFLYQQKGKSRQCVITEGKEKVQGEYYRYLISSNTSFMDRQPEICSQRLEIQDNTHLNMSQYFSYDDDRLFSYYNSVMPPLNNFPLFYMGNAQLCGQQRVANSTIQSFKSNETKES